MEEVEEEAPLIVFANRLPIVRHLGDWEIADGGLVTALRPVVNIKGATWVGWDGGYPGLPSRIDNINLAPVSLTTKQVKGHYQGFSNRTLWPLFHDLARQPVFDKKDWEAYKQVNQKFAEDSRTMLQIQPAAFLWVQDYHLLLLPKYLRQINPQAVISFFLHIPFPALELFAQLPWGKEILESLLEADTVAFHTDLSRVNFLRVCNYRLPGLHFKEGNIIFPDGRIVKTRTHPISIDAEDFAIQALRPEVGKELKRLQKQFAGRTVLLGVDRLDYTKGIIERLRAIERLLENQPSLCKQIVFIQIAVPSRDDVHEYKQLRQKVEAEVGRINGRFTEPGHDVPIHYLYRSMRRERILAYYRLADIALVTPLKDGMNLVAKEFVVVQAAANHAGVLILSEFAGAARELTAALICNPYSNEDMAEQIQKALAMPTEEKAQRINEMAKIVATNDVYSWVTNILADEEQFRNFDLFHGSHKH